MAGWFRNIVHLLVSSTTSEPSIPTRLHHKIDVVPNITVSFIHSTLFLATPCYGVFRDQPDSRMTAVLVFRKNELFFNTIFVNNWVHQIRCILVMIGIPVNLKNAESNRIGIWMNVNKSYIHKNRNRQALFDTKTKHSYCKTYLNISWKLVVVKSHTRNLHDISVTSRRYY